METEEDIAPLPSSAPLHIFDLHDFLETIPEGMTTICIRLDGSMQSDMSWKTQCEQAAYYVDRGYSIFWMLDLGLFKDLRCPLSNTMQFQSLCLAVEHFRDTVWEKFRTMTVGLTFYRGSLDFSLDFPWDEPQDFTFRTWLQDIGRKEHSRYQLESSKEGQKLIRSFCGRAAAHYIELLGTRVPDTLPLFALIDTSMIEDPLEKGKLISKEKFERVQLIIKGMPNPVPRFTWEGGEYTNSTFGRTTPLPPCLQNPSIGICLPPDDVDEVQLSDAMTLLADHQILFKTIPEEGLMTEWDGLDYLLYIPAYLSVAGQRKLRGFCAAGGTPVAIGPLLGLPQEISLDAFKMIFLSI